MKVDITKLLIVFDEILTLPTNEELGVYWFRSTRTDDLIITLSFSTYENYLGLLVCNNLGIAIADINMENCSEINVLDENRKCLEILHDNGNGRCFLCLSGSPILEYQE